MSIPVLIIGPSGTGKSTSMRNLNPDNVLLIQALKKPLPFRAGWKPWNNETKKGTIYVTDKASHIVACIEKAHSNNKKIIIIDDFQYQMSNQFMRRAKEKGYEKFTDIGKDAWDIVQAAINSHDEIRVYILSHTQSDEYGENIKMKTIGKMLDDKITMEGMFSIVLRSQIRDGEYIFSTQNNGNDTVKSPMGLFELEIPNDLAEIDAAVCDYYEIDNTEELLNQIEILKEKFDDKDFLKTVTETVDKSKTDSKKLFSIVKKLKLKLK